MYNTKGFTIVELLVVIAIIAILSSIVLYSITQYINTSKDASVGANLATLMPAGEVWYNSNTYVGFCGSDVVKRAYGQIPKPKFNIDCSSGATPGLCCSVNVYGDAWAACAQTFRDDTKAYCVDSRGVQKEIDNSSCTSSITVCP